MVFLLFAISVLNVQQMIVARDLWLPWAEFVGSLKWKSERTNSSSATAKISETGNLDDYAWEDSGV